MCKQLDLFSRHLLPRYKKDINKSPIRLKLCDSSAIYRQQRTVMESNFVYMNRTRVAITPADCCANNKLYAAKKWKKKI